jgi:hypothetical protein
MSVSIAVRRACRVAAMIGDHGYQRGDTRDTGADGQRCISQAEPAWGWLTGSPSMFRSRSIVYINSSDHLPPAHTTPRTGSVNSQGPLPTTAERVGQRSTLPFR